MRTMLQEAIGLVPHTWTRWKEGGRLSYAEWIGIWAPNWRRRRRRRWLLLLQLSGWSCDPHDAWSIDYPRTIAERLITRRGILLLIQRRQDQRRLLASIGASSSSIRWSRHFTGLLQHDVRLVDFLPAKIRIIARHRVVVLLLVLLVVIGG